MTILQLYNSIHKMLNEGVDPNTLVLKREDGDELITPNELTPVKVFKDAQYEMWFTVVPGDHTMANVPVVHALEI